MMCIKNIKYYYKCTQGQNPSSQYKLAVTRGIKIQTIINIKKINNTMENPFHRPSLLPPRQQYSSNTVPRYDHNISDAYLPKSEHYQLNIWSFRNDYNNNFTPLYTSRHTDQISSFEKTMMVNSVTSRKQAQPTKPSSAALKYSRIQENPFHRKNLFISRQDVEEEIQRDLNKIHYEYSGAFISNQVGNSQRPSINNSYEQNNNEGESRHSGNRQISNNGSLIMNLIDKQVSNHIIKTFMPPNTHKDVIQVRGKKFTRARVDPKRN